MNVRAYRADDYPVLCGWWAGHGWGSVVLPPSHIPPTTRMVELDDETPAACGMFYKYEGVPVARMGFVVNNPYLVARERVGALKALAAELVDGLQKCGVRTAYAFYEDSALRRIFHDAGFRETRASVPELTWAVGIDEALGRLKGETGL